MAFNCTTLGSDAQTGFGTAGNVWLVKEYTAYVAVGAWLLGGRFLQFTDSSSSVGSLIAAFKAADKNIEEADADPNMVKYFPTFLAKCKEDLEKINEKVEDLQALCRNRSRLQDVSDFVTTFSSIARQARRHIKALERLEERLQHSSFRAAMMARKNAPVQPAAQQLQDIEELLPGTWVPQAAKSYWTSVVGNLQTRFYGTSRADLEAPLAETELVRRGVETAFATPAGTLRSSVASVNDVVDQELHRWMGDTRLCESPTPLSRTGSAQLQGAAPSSAATIEARTILERMDRLERALSARSSP